MSAFMVNDYTYNSVALTLGEWATNSDKYFVQEMFASDENRNPIGVVDAFVTKLKQMNIEALKQRYPDYPDMWKDRETPLMPAHGRRLKPVELFKQLTCISYQMSEGDVPESHVYKQLDKLSELLAYHIVVGLPEYDEVEWGLSDEQAS